jgi:hypothetical protein
VLLDKGVGFLVAGDGTGSSWNTGYLCLFGNVSGLDLVTESIDNFRLRSDEGDSCILDLLCELGVLGQEAVPAGNPASQICGSNRLTEATHPGWIISTPCSSAIRMMSSCAKYAATGVIPFPTW